MPLFKSHNTLEFGRNVRLRVRVEAELTSFGAVLNRLRSRLTAGTAMRPGAQKPVSRPQTPAASPQFKRRKSMQHKKVAGQNRRQNRQKPSKLSTDEVRAAIAQFYPEGQLNYVHSNRWGPNFAALKAMVEAAGFTVTRVLPGPSAFDRGIVVVRRKTLD